MVCEILPGFRSTTLKIRAVLGQPSQLFWRLWCGRALDPCVRDWTCVYHHHGIEYVSNDGHAHHKRVATSLGLCHGFPPGQGELLEALLWLSLQRRVSSMRCNS